MIITSRFVIATNIHLDTNKKLEYEIEIMKECVFGRYYDVYTKWIDFISMLYSLPDNSSIEVTFYKSVYSDNYPEKLSIVLNDLDNLDLISSFKKYFINFANEDEMKDFLSFSYHPYKFSSDEYYKNKIILLPVEKVRVLNNGKN